MPKPLPAEEPIPEGMQRRLLVVDDLGVVHAGDHVMIVGNVVYAVDTSRRPNDFFPRTAPSQPVTEHRSDAAPRRPGRQPKAKMLATVQPENIFDIIRENQPVTSFVISTLLGIPRNETPSRNKVTRLIRQMLDEGTIVRVSESAGNQHQYGLPGAKVESAPQAQPTRPAPEKAQKPRPEGVQTPQEKLLFAAKAHPSALPANARAIALDTIKSNGGQAYGRQIFRTMFGGDKQPWFATLQLRHYLNELINEGVITRLQGGTGTGEQSLYGVSSSVQ